MILATKKMRQVKRLIPAARMDMRLDALGPKCFVIISIHIKDSQEIRIPPSRAIQSSWMSVLFASRFIQITLTTNNVTTVAGMILEFLLSVYKTFKAEFHKKYIVYSKIIYNYILFSYNEFI